MVRIRLLSLQVDLRGNEEPTARMECREVQMAWIDDFLDDQEQRHQRQENEAMWQRQVSSVAPQLFRTLSNVVSSIVETYVRRTGDNRVTFYPGHGSFVVHREGDLPEFHLDAKLNGTVIDVRTTSKPATALEAVTVETTIVMIGKGADKCFYRINGKELTNIEDLSKEILLPVLELL